MNWFRVFTFLWITSCAIGCVCGLVAVWMAVYLGPHAGWLSEKFLWYQSWSFPGAFGGLLLAKIFLKAAEHSR